MKPLAELLEASAALHGHLCPRQVLGVRMGILAGEIFGLDLPQTDKRLLTIAETDGCLVDGIGAATNCRVGRRTLRIEDLGKVAATFVDTGTGHAVRLSPRAGCRQEALAWAPQARSRWDGQRLGYERMPAHRLLSVQQVRLLDSVSRILSRPGRRVLCQICGEEILNDRQIVHEGSVLCRTCRGEGYYAPRIHPAEAEAATPEASPAEARPARLGFAPPESG